MDFKNRFEACAYLRDYYSTSCDRPFYCYIMYDEDKPFYVGISRSWKRLHTHEKEVYLDRNKNQLKARKIKKMHNTGKIVSYKIVGFYHNLLEANHAEKSLILFYGRIVDSTGTLTNLADGGEGRSGLNNSEKQKEAVRLANSKPKSEETRRKLSESMKRTVAKNGASFTGKRHTEETKKKMSIARKDPSHTQNNLKGSEHFNYGKKRSEETKRKIKESLAKIDTSCTEERRLKLIDYFKNAPLLTCPHCGKQMTNPAPFKRYHGEQCKNRNHE